MEHEGGALTAAHQRPPLPSAPPPRGGGGGGGGAPSALPAAAAAAVAVVGAVAGPGCQTAKGGRGAADYCRLSLGIALTQDNLGRY